MTLLFILSVLSLDSILNQPALAPAQCGIYVIDLKTDRVIYAYNSQKLLIPASNMKLISTGACLTYLGPEFRCMTKLAIDGAVSDGRLHGDIILIGGGDPTFSMSGFERFILALKSRKISEVTGNIVIDDSYFTELSLNGNDFRFERLPVGWAWHYLDARYAPEVSALSFNKNVVNVRMEATAIGSVANVTLQPDTRYVTLISDMITKEGEDSIIIMRRPEINEIYVGGGVGEGHVRNIEVSVIDPALYAGTYFEERLQAHNIRVHGDVIRPPSPDPEANQSYHVIDSVLSAPLADVLIETNTESVNLYAETLLKILGARFQNEGSFRAGLLVLDRFLGLCGADASAVSLWDGSGLSRHNLVSPYYIALVLRYMYLSRHSALFFDMLPTSGEGTLERRFKDLKGYVRAKTGSLHAVSCLSGYLRFDDTDYCFSMMFNNYSCSRKTIEEIQEKIILALQQHLAPETIMTPGE